ncbi:MAG: hypothetical protein Q7J80_02485 [Anaerolineales bacterium]|nr:hypothetical protein [Anaerolineales bacterium]
MKKIVLSLASVLAATAFAPEAAAVPSFARQTGMACTACHAQHFPILNSFGRAFKSAGYTMMGAQGKIEGDHISLPDTLNASLLLKVRYYKDNSVAVVNTVTTANNKGNGQLQFLDEAALFFGGRVSENVGFLMEGNIVSGGQLLAGIKVPFVFDMGGAKLSVIPFTTDAMGVQYGYEQSSGGVLRANRWSENRRETSAVQYNADRNANAAGAGDGGAATGFAFVAQNDMGWVNYSRWSPSFVPAGNGQAAANSSAELKSNYFRIAATPTVGSWAMVVGAGKMSGESFSSNGGTAVTTKQTFFDFQAQGEVGGKELGVYAQHANAPSGVNPTTGAVVAAVGTAYVNTYNRAARTRTATTIGADYSVIPHVLSLGASYRNADSGAALGTEEENAWNLGAVYDYAQNIAFHVNYTKFSGNSTNAAGTVKSQYMGMLEVAF